MIVASGTSTPTSITVVETRMAMSPARKRSITASFSAGFMRPWTRPTRAPKRGDRSAKRSSAAARSIFSDSATSGQTQ